MGKRTVRAIAGEKRTGGVTRAASLAALLGLERAAGTFVEFTCSGCERRQYQWVPADLTETLLVQARLRLAAKDFVRAEREARR